MKRGTLSYLLVFLFILFISNNILADSEFVFKAGESFSLEIPMGNADLSPCTTCSCSYTLFYPNGSAWVKNAAGTNDNGYCVYTTKTNILGTYGAEMNFNNGVDYGRVTFNFDVTPSGNSGNSNIVFFVFVILLVYGITFISFFYGRNIPLTVLGGMAMMFLGIYIINNGIIIFRDTLTNYISYITIGIGFMLSIWALLEQFEII